MSKDLIHYHAPTKTATYLGQDEAGNTIVHKEQDTTQIWDDNKSLRNMVTSLDRYGDGATVLRAVPFWLLEDWKAKGWFTKEYFHKCMADERAQPYKVFR